MKILVIGSGGREHALAWKLAQSPRVTQVFVAPGNAGTAREAKCSNVPIAADDLPALFDFARDQGMDLTVVGPEAPLAAGIVDIFNDGGLRIFGPTREAAMLESSKSFAKDFLARHRIPTAEYRVFSELAPALDYIHDRGAPLVIKADGLAAGKGVVVAMQKEEAQQAVRDMLGGRFGEAGARVVIEDYLEGEEVSFICMVDGKNILPLATSQDHKRRDEGDRGPNTGGMGAYSPAPQVSPQIEARILREIMQPAVVGMALEGLPYTGFLYAGLMIDPQGAPKVLEFNCRLGDPEAQPLLMRLQSDLSELLQAGIEGRLDEVGAAWSPRLALGVVLAAKGYPEAVVTGEVIEGLDAPLPEDVKLFHAGTRLDEAGRVLTAGGRVLCATALGDNLYEAQRRAYAALEGLRCNGCFFRRDIGWRAQGLA